jgi:hypothetical protein
MTPEERRRRLEERLKNATPQERERIMQRMRQFRPDGGGDRPGAVDAGPQKTLASPQTQTPAGARGGSRESAPATTSLAGSGALTIDALFGPLPPTQSVGRVWRFVDGRLTMVRVRLGVTDGTNTELVSGDLPEGTTVVTGVILQPAPSATRGGGTTSSPLLPQRGRPRGR